VLTPEEFLKSTTPTSLTDTGIGFWDALGRKHAYPIGGTGAGDLVLQVAAGSERGHIYAVNHETYSGLGEALLIGGPELEDLKRDIAELYPEFDQDLDYENLTTDQFIKIISFERFDGATKLADSLELFLSRLLAIHGL